MAGLLIDFHEHDFLQFYPVRSVFQAIQGKTRVRETQKLPVYFLVKRSIIAVRGKEQLVPDSPGKRTMVCASYFFTLNSD